jgi:hypothetical protein
VTSVSLCFVLTQVKYSCSVVLECSIVLRIITG